MPAYDYACETCGYKTEMYHGFAACDEIHECPQCGNAMYRPISTVPAVLFHSSDMGWEHENGGRGRHISQFELTPEEKIDRGMKPTDKTPEAFVRSRREAAEVAARKDMKITSGAPKK